MYLFELTDGETTINLKNSNGVCVEFNAWSPGVSALADGGYATVRESIPVAIKGASGSSVMSLLRSVNRLLDSANRFARGQSSRPVLLRYQQAAFSAVFSALVLGGTLVLPNNFTNQENWKTLFPVYLEIERRGQWLTADSSNKLLNPSFEDWTGNDADNWIFDLNSFAPTAKALKEETVVYEGEKSLLMENVSVDDVAYQSITFPDADRNGTTVKISAWVNVVEGAALLRVDTAYTGSGYTYNKVGETLGNWELIDLYYTFNGNTITVAISGAYDSRLRSTFYIDDVRVTLVNESGDTGDESGRNGINGDVVSFRLSNYKEQFPSPTKVTIKDVRVGSRHRAGYILLANQSDSLFVINAGELIPASKYSTVSDAAAYPRGANVLRYTPTDLLAYGQEIAIPPLPRNVRGDARRAVFINVRNNSGSHDGYVYMYVAQYGVDSITRRVLVPRHTGTAAPRWIYVGEARGDAAAAITIFCQMNGFGTGHTMDIDAIVIAWMDDGRTSVVQIDESGLPGTSAIGTLIIDHRQLSGMTPIVQVIDATTGLTSGWSAGGDLEIYTDGAALEGIFLGTGASGSINSWRQVTGSTVIENAWRVSRLPARLSPE